ncbi:MAG: cation:proton antiporter subunit C [Oscillospiraceae bacterium]|jgi:multicomponent Na+:H+ antiporter subunit C|nr:cation:proton antiporter subunit C [Oscillospiraceae bacterium]
MGSNLTSNYFEVTAVICFSIGFTMLFLNKNLIKKVIGFNFMDSSIFLFLASNGYITGRISPIITNGSVASENYINPIPAGLVLTGIVVSVSVSAFLLALTTRLYLRYHTLDLDEMIRLSRAEDD